MLTGRLIGTADQSGGGGDFETAFPGYFLGPGTLGGNANGTGLDTEPPAGYQAGDLLMLAYKSFVPPNFTWSAYSESPLTWNFFSKFADGDSTDIIPAAASGVASMMWGWRDSTGTAFSRWRGNLTLNRRLIGVTPWTVRASWNLLTQEQQPGYARIYLYAGDSGFIGTAQSVTPDDFFVKDGELLRQGVGLPTLDTNIWVFGHRETVPAAAIPEFDIPYQIPASSNKTHAQLTIPIQIN